MPEHHRRLNDPGDDAISGPLLSCAVQSRIAARSSRACGVKLTFKAEVAQYPVHRDQAGPILRLRQTALDLGALPCLMTPLRSAVLLGQFILRIVPRLHHAKNALSPDQLQGDRSKRTQLIPDRSDLGAVLYPLTLLKGASAL
ncbi:hypothetical protein [Sphingobium mellinum]|uniref:hypothetical protein n=1 Tax=Sphingobium mellinum TaxID=1387166 RepID=UPI0030EE66FA